MCGNQKFFICKHCGNLIGLMYNKGVPMVCCGEKMAELVPNTVEASAEKHLPFVTVAGNLNIPGRPDLKTVFINVAVGSVFHPMDEKHNIAFVYVETEFGGQRKCLKTGEEPIVSFAFVEDKPIAVYAYCNLHGLWKTEIN